MIERAKGALQALAPPRTTEHHRLARQRRPSAPPLPVNGALAGARTTNATTPAPSHQRRPTHCASHLRTPLSPSMA
ncbi:hypothetical protein U1Q18_048639 [Sarracenia purpurea var. burkii]